MINQAISISLSIRMSPFPLEIGLGLKSVQTLKQLSGIANELGQITTSNSDTSMHQCFTWALAYTTDRQTYIMQQQYTSAKNIIAGLGLIFITPFLLNKLRKPTTRYQNMTIDMGIIVSTIWGIKMFICGVI
jgi:hypothetical protein